jgi:lantibiotic modifying enzyme
MARIVASSWPLEIAADQARDLEKTYREIDGAVCWVAKLDAEQTGPLFGAAHGSSGIALALYKWGELTNSSNSIELARHTMRTLYEFSTRKGIDFIPIGVCSLHGRQSVNEWCHCTSGYLWCLQQIGGGNYALRS